MTKIYADPGTSVQAFAVKNSGTSVAATITCSGYLVNVSPYSVLPARYRAGVAPISRRNAATKALVLA